MITKLQDWFEFHLNVLDKRKLPLFIWALGMLLALLGQHVYSNVVKGFYDSNLLRTTIENNIDVLKHGLWIIPLVIFLIFFELGLSKHKKNIRKLYDLE